MAKESVFVRLPPDVRAALLRAAATEKRTNSAIVEIALRKYLHIPDTGPTSEQLHRRAGENV
jgi:predicted transcriptional regulator